MIRQHSIRFLRVVVFCCMVAGGLTALMPKRPHTLAAGSAPTVINIVGWRGSDRNSGVAQVALPSKAIEVEISYARLPPLYATESRLPGCLRNGVFAATLGKAVSPSIQAIGIFRAASTTPWSLERIVHAPGASIGCLSLSPDGSAIAYWCSSENRKVVRVLDLSSGILRTILLKPAFRDGVSISLGHEHMIYVWDTTERSETTAIWAYDRFGRGRIVGTYHAVWTNRIGDYGVTSQYKNSVTDIRAVRIDPSTSASSYLDFKTGRPGDNEAGVRKAYVYGLTSTDDGKFWGAMYRTRDAANYDVRNPEIDLWKQGQAFPIYTADDFKFRTLIPFGLEAPR